jgi:hypothetical protein
MAEKGNKPIVNGWGWDGVDGAISAFARTEFAGARVGR